MLMNAHDHCKENPLGRGGEAVDPVQGSSPGPGRYGCAMSQPVARLLDVPNCV